MIFISGGEVVDTDDPFPPQPPTFKSNGNTPKWLREYRQAQEKIMESKLLQTEGVEPAADDTTIAAEFDIFPQVFEGKPDPIQDVVEELVEFGLLAGAPLNIDSDDIVRLAVLRIHQEHARQIKAEIDKLWKADPEYIEAVQNIADDQKLIDKLTFEIQVQYEMEARLNDKGKVAEPHPHEAVTLKKFDTTRVAYDPEKALEFCKREFTPALTLNAKVYEKAALDGNLPKDIALVIPGYEIRAQIASDLSGFVCFK